MFADINLELFNFINHSIQNPVFDCIMPVITHFGGFEFLGVLLLIVLVYAHMKKKNTLKRIIFLSIVALLFSDIIAVVLKHLIHEPRPFATLSNLHLLISENDPFSFPSGHATSTVSVVTFLILNMKELTEKYYKVIDIFLIIFAVLIAFSRIYVGVHYPFDVLAGIILGLFGAFVVNKYKDKIAGIFFK